MAAPFVAVALRIQGELHITDKKGTGMIMKFSKIYPPEKMGKILQTTKSFRWWESNAIAAFMLAIKTVNREEKEGKI